MKHAFGIAAVDKWARFSGDYNPIHFDLAHARILGEERLVVHGMLATMPFKQGAWHQYRADEGAREDGWIKLRTLFRKPLPHDDAVVLTSAPGRVAGFRINAEAGGQEHFRGSCAGVAAPAPVAPAQRVDARAHPVPVAQVEAFLAGYPEFPEPWIALDAVIFAEFMRNKLDEIQALARASAPADAPWSRQVIVHSSHTIHFDAAFFATDPAGIDWSSLTYGMLDPDLLWGERRLVCTIPIWVKAHDRQVMALEIGVVAVLD
jgi:hypothetical protein